MQGHTDISIIIVNYNTFQHTINCIQSIISETKQFQYEIILVDNASSECPAQHFLDLFPNIVLIENTYNVGFGRANNIGMQKGRGKYFLLLNSDTVIIDHAIDKCLSFYIQHSSLNIGILGCSQIDEFNNNAIDYSLMYNNSSLLNYVLSNPLCKQYMARYYIKKHKKDKDYFCVDFVHGAFIMLKREIWEETGGFDPDFFMYYEETEWYYRIKKKNLIVYLPTIRIKHLQGKSYITNDKLHQMYVSQGLYWYKLGYLRYIIYLFITYLIYVPCWTLYGVKNIFFGKKTKFMRFLKIYSNLFYFYIQIIPKKSAKFGSRNQYLRFLDYTR